MSTVTESQQRQHSPMLRMMRIGEHVIFYVLLLIAIALAVRDGDRVVAIVTVVVAMGLWYGIGARFTMQPRSALIRYGWLTGLVALWAVGMALNPQFAWVSFPLMLLFVHLLPIGVAIAAVLAMTVLVGIWRWMAVDSGDWLAGVIGPSVGALVVIAFGLSYRNLIEQDQRRQVLVDELLATQDDLLATSDALATAQRAAGVASERERLAREIHDTLAQGFSSIVLLARAAQRGGDTQQVLSQIESTASDNLREARAFVRDLAPDPLQATPLVEAIGRIAERLGEQTSIAVQTRVEGQPFGLDVNREVALLRVAQSAISNIRQHSQARSASVTLTFEESDVVLDVVDDGVGFSPTERAGSGFGLGMMRERMRSVGGRVAVDSAPGEGTAVSARVPVATVPAGDHR